MECVRAGRKGLENFGEPFRYQGVYTHVRFRIGRRYPAWVSSTPAILPNRAKSRRITFRIPCPISDASDPTPVVEERRLSAAAECRIEPVASQLFSKPRLERWELTMRKTIIRSTTVVESGIRQVRDVKAGRDCLCALLAARQFLARLNHSLNASVARAWQVVVRHYLATFAGGLHAHRERSFPMGCMPQWFGMSAVAIALPQGVSKPATSSGRVS
jgi:hypothetical protein